MTRVATEPPEIRMVLENVAWSTYVELADSRSGSIPKMTFDEGLLEMMSPKRQHESIGRLVGRLLETYSEVKDIDIISLASTTFRRSKLQKAFEADESYYVTHAAELLEKEELDFEIDPPPDLVIEVEITSSAIRKMKLFAKIGVPEVWRHDGDEIRMFRLVDDDYEPILSSVEVPGLTALMINEMLDQRLKISETKLIREFRERVAHEAGS
jgi:Uma2 family endonuclease